MKKDFVRTVPTHHDTMPMHHLQMKIEVMRKDNKGKDEEGEKENRGEEEEEEPLVEQQDPQQDGGDNAAQPGEDLVGQQLHQQNLMVVCCGPQGESRQQGQNRRGEASLVQKRG